MLDESEADSLTANWSAESVKAQLKTKVQTAVRLFSLLLS